MRKKKPQMNIFLANQTWAGGGYLLHYGRANKPSEMNLPSHGSKHRKYSTAIQAKNKLVRKYKKKGYKIHYIYAPD